MAGRAALDLWVCVPFCASDLGADVISLLPRGEDWGVRCLVREELASPEQPGRQWAWTQEGSGQGSGARGCGRAHLLLTTLPPAVQPGLRGPHTLDGACVPAPSRLFERGW